jgi:hypothetical protein
LPEVFDWRKSNFTTAKKFEAFVASTPALKGKPFDIIAHKYSPFAIEAFPKLNFQEMLCGPGGDVFSPMKLSGYPLAGGAKS